MTSSAVLMPQGQREEQRLVDKAVDVLSTGSCVQNVDPSHEASALLCR